MNDTQEIHADIEACDRALDELLRAIVSYDLDAEAQLRRQALLRSLGREDGRTDVDRARFRSLMTDPVRGPMRDGLKRIGAEIHRLSGGANGMLDSFDRVCDLDPAHGGRRAAILNASWNGVGSGDDRWWS